MCDVRKSASFRSAAQRSLATSAGMRCAELCSNVNVVASKASRPPKYVVAQTLTLSPTQGYRMLVTLTLWRWQPHVLGAQPAPSASAQAPHTPPLRQPASGGQGLWRPMEFCQIPDVGHLYSDSR
jgi:hypothetical protein